MAASACSPALPLLLALLACASDAHRASADLEAHTAFHLATDAVDSEPVGPAAEALLDASSDLAEATRPRPMSISLPERWTPQLARVGALGSGTFGDVGLFSLKCSEGARVAVKEMGVGAMKREVAALQAFKARPNIISYFDHAEAADQGYIMMEAATGGTLTSFTELDDEDDDWGSDEDEEDEEPAENDLHGVLFLGMLQGVKEMHAAKVVHCDLKPDNVLLLRKCGKEGTCTAKLADLGSACAAEGSDAKSIKQCGSSCEGTPKYAAPDTSVDLKSDMWSLGVILYELTFNRLPKEFHGSEDYIKSATKTFKLDDDESYKRLPDSWRKRLLEALLQPDPSSRASAPLALKIATHWGEEKGFLGRVGAEVSELPACFQRAGGSGAGVD